MATETQKPEVEAPKKNLTPLDLNQDSSNSEENPNLAAHTNGAAAAASKALTTAIVSPTVNDIHKKMKRAERFGLPVNMSEEEKRNSRSQRFGTAAGSEVSKSAEEQKRKARAERFGISVPADEEVKKRSRAERFGSDVKVDNAEEERRKARALRFSHSHEAAVARCNGDRDSGPQETVTVDSAREGG